jgi:hypothetical protein
MTTTHPAKRVKLARQIVKARELTRQTVRERWEVAATQIDGVHLSPEYEHVICK